MENNLATNEDGDDEEDDDFLDVDSPEPSQQESYIDVSLRTI